MSISSVCVLLHARVRVCRHVYVCVYPLCPTRCSFSGAGNSYKCFVFLQRTNIITVRRNKKIIPCHWNPAGFYLPYYYYYYFFKRTGTLIPSQHGIIILVEQPYRLEGRATVWRMWSEEFHLQMPSQKNRHNGGKVVVVVVVEGRSQNPGIRQYYWWVCPPPCKCISLDSPQNLENLRDFS